ncbi:MAG: hypothetical protein KBT35_07930 [Firmicutes bacterium]|nr:hypothetical protein [Candidatus Colivicinus equi]
MEKTKKNEGKLFESDFQKSIDIEKILVKRFNDNAASFGGSNNTRFTSTNECDYELFDPESRTLYFLELKSTLSSLTFWREDFDGKSFNIKRNQILGLSKFSKYENTVCGLVINFRSKELNDTFFVYIDEFVKYTNQLNKKSINYNDVIKMSPIKVQCNKKITRYKYDIDKFINETKK